MSCLRHSYQKGEPKGSRLCRKCKQVEGTVNPHPRGNITITEQKDVEVVDLGPNIKIEPNPTLQLIQGGQGETYMLEVSETLPNAPTETVAMSSSLATPSSVLSAGPVGVHSDYPLVVNSLLAKDMKYKGLWDDSKHQEATLLPLGNEIHSKLGASSAERWMECPGSVKLTEYLQSNSVEDNEPDPDWTLDGREAHALAAYVLENEIAETWMAMDPIKFPRVTADMAEAVQVYVDYIRSIDGHKAYELKLHRHDLHPLMFGTLDCVIHSNDDPITLEVVDFKNGAGVFVPVENNVQLMYYACMVLDNSHIGSDRVKLTIVQPNVHVGSPIRSWITTVHELRTWLHEELLPAMNRAMVGDYLSLGKWCQFCPAKMVCPAMQQLATKFASQSDSRLPVVSDDMLGRLYEEARAVRFYLKAVEAEVYKRLMNSHEVPGAKLIWGRANREWKEGAEMYADGEFGEEAYKREFISPAQLEKLPGGKEFVAEWAYQKEAKLNVAYADDPKSAVVPKKGSDLLDNMKKV